MPGILYHGTSDTAWARMVDGTLYLVVDRSDAENYAEEAVIADRDPDREEASPHSTAIVVEFAMSDILTIDDVEMRPDWGWGGLAQGSTWQDSLNAVGSLCLQGFGMRHKHLGRIVKAF